MPGCDTAPIACTLTAEDLQDRRAWIAALARDARRSHERHDLVLDLRYAPEAAGRVREMVRREQACCAFLAFELCEEPQEIRLTIRAPGSARMAIEALFATFVAGTETPPGCHCD